MANPITRLFATITGRKRREEKLAKELAIIKFRYYRISARMLVIALENCMKSFPDFLEKTNCIEYLTLTFRDNTNEISIFILPDLRRFGFEKQAEALGAVTDNWYLPISNSESQMKEYIQLLRNLFFTPDPE